MAQQESVDTSKFISEPKAVYSLDIENLEHLVAYSPNETSPDSILSKVHLPAGALFTTITAAEHGEKKWSTIQVSKDRHMELHSGLVYLNHSCVPSLEIDTDMMEVRVSKDRELKVGDELTFFYPSTEWIMDKPFKCSCGAGDVCLGIICGASDLDAKLLGSWFVNEHILKLKREQDRKSL